MVKKTTAKKNAGPRSSIKRTVKDQSGAGKFKIGEILQKAGYITANQFDEAKKIHKKTGERLGRILLDNGTIERDTIANFLSRMHNYTLVSIDLEPPSQEALDLVPYETAKQFLCVPLRMAGNTLQITMAEPTDHVEVEALQDIVSMGLDVCVSPARDIND
ncbi:MAG: type IV-A pilus assembly ATPase PilB, partial [Desulfobulbaceae bacterium]|nr:type IV-A pilus assembly ATPase PilB [Desulfobulbaceae bacterium]